MKRTIMIAIVLLLLPAGLLAGPLGESGGHDLDALWARAQSGYDLDQQDAVLLLESRQISLTFDGACKTRVHRVVWVGTSVGIHDYADLRVPWNAATSTLEVERLRTWRADQQDPAGRWWPDAEKVSDTAVVPTLPYAVDRADDYTDLRETMLLHDGVAPGCIMETVYTITERGIPAAGGIVVAPQADPCVRWELRVMTAPGREISHAELNGAVSPQSVNPTKGQGLLWQADNLPALRRPLTLGPEAYEPAVAWSTWTSWQELGDHWRDGFRAALVLEPEQVDQLRAKLNPAQSPRQRLNAVATFLNDMVRPVHCSAESWRFAPRPAARTLLTAYGHDLDRAVLAAALLEAAGFPVEPLVIGRGPVLAAPEIPRLGDLDRVVLRTTALRDAILDPGSGQVLAMDEVYGHPFWFLDRDSAGWGPQPLVAFPATNSLTVAVNLAQEEEGAWSGEGYFLGRTLFSHYGGLLAEDDLREGYVGDLAGSVVPGLKVTRAAPDLLVEDGVEVTFSGELPAVQPDAAGHRTLVVGQPAGGVLERLPRDVHLYEETRRSPVLGAAGWTQTVIVRLEVAEEELLHRPAPRTLTNPAGTFTLAMVYKDGWLTLTRTLALAEGPEGRADWPALRALLLEEADPANGTVILK